MALALTSALTSIDTLLKDDRVVALKRAFSGICDIYVVGGSVRDVLLGKAIGDIDFTCALPPEEITKISLANNFRVFPTGLKHQTVTVLISEESSPLASSLEITTFHGPKMRPTGGVSAGGSIEEDLGYRDFTVNALALRVTDGKLIDIADGQKDLQDKTIRAVGDPAERFREDPLRLMRMVRFACLEGFTADPATSTAAKSLSALLSQVSIERIRAEFTKILTSNRPAFGLKLLATIGLLEVFLPELQNCVGFEQNKFHYHDVFDHTLEVVEKTPADEILRLAAVFHDIGKPPTLSVDENGERHFYKHEIDGALITRNCMERLRYPNSTVSAVEILVRTHMRPLSAGAGGLRRLLRDTSELFPQWRVLKEADSLSTRTEREKMIAELKEFDITMEEIKRGPDVSPLKNLAVNGHDLIAAGIPESRRIGELLNALHEHVLDNPADNEKSTLLELLKKLM